MNQKQNEQYNESDMKLLDLLEETIESGETEVQKVATLLTLHANPEEAFAGLIEISKKMEEIALKIKHPDARIIVLENILFFNERFKEVMAQIKKPLEESNETDR